MSILKVSPITYLLKVKLHFLFTLFLISLSAQAQLTKLQIDYQTTPLGIDTDKPIFSWQMQDLNQSKGAFQKAYQIKVNNEKKQQVWDSSKIENSLSVGIQYSGEALKPRTRYHYTVTIWDEENEQHSKTSWFETGLMSTKIEAWNQAKWIGVSDEDLNFYSHYLSVFKLGYSIQLDRAFKSTKASFLMGGNDTRLMDRNKNIQGVRSSINESYIEFEFDTAPLNFGKNAKLHVYRVGYSEEDQKNVPFRSFEIPRTLVNTANQYEQHQFYIQSNFGLVEIFLNGTQEEHKISENDDPSNSPRARKGFNLNPVGAGNNYISFHMVGDIGFSIDPRQKASFSNIKILNFRSPSNTLFQDDMSRKDYTGLFSSLVNEHPNVVFQEHQIKVSGGDKGLLVLKNPSKSSTPMLRTEFELPLKKVVKARLYLTSRGIYEIHLNGKRLGNEYFNPGLTQYNKHHLYQTYDLTDQILSQSKNAIGIWLSEGWWSGNITYSGENWNFFGDRQSVLAQLIVTFEDGSEKIIASNTSDWKVFTEGPIRYGSFFQGEVYDARLNAMIKGWSNPDFNDTLWKAATEVPLEQTTYQDEDFNFNELQFKGKMGEAAKIVKTIQPISMDEVRPGVFVYDMGQNMVGIPKVVLPKGNKGDTITLRYAEVKYPNLKEYKGEIGMIMLENIRAALTQDLYIRSGDKETIQPRFTFHGFRFLEISGIKTPIPLESIEGQVISSIDELSSHYETSNAKVNKLWENITWSLRGNFLSIPTDTPARNERMGWSGDINVFSKTATFLAPVQPFLNRHLMSMRDLQSSKGRFTDVAPVGGGFGGTLWGSAGIIIPWELYQQYGDIKTLEEHFDSMKFYIEFLNSKIEADSGYLIEGPLGDWLSPEGYKNDPTLFWAAYHMKGLEIVIKTAEILGRSKEVIAYKSLYEARKKFLNKTYFDYQTGKTIHKGHQSLRFGPPLPPERQISNGDFMDTQASYAIPLDLEVLNEKNSDSAIKLLAQTINRENTDELGVSRPPFSLMTGFIGTASLSSALSKYKRHDLAYKLLQQSTYPSWLYSVDNGATTIWERLNSYTNEKGFGGNNSMNSFNHYSFGSVASWMYNHSLGIQRDTRNVAFKHFILQPTPDPAQEMKWAKGYYNSMYGKIESAWEWTESGWNYKAKIPPNTTATLKFQKTIKAQIQLDGKPIEVNTNGIQGIEKHEEELWIELTSGTYSFKINKK